MLTEDEQAVMDFDDGDFDDPMEEEEIVAETDTSLKEETYTKQEDSVKTGLNFL